MLATMRPSQRAIRARVELEMADSQARQILAEVNGRTDEALEIIRARVLAEIRPSVGAR